MYQKPFPGTGEHIGGSICPLSQCRKLQELPLCLQLQQKQLNSKESTKLLVKNVIVKISIKQLIQVT